MFVGTTAFEVIVKQQIKRLEEPSLKCCQLVYDELIRILGQLLAKVVRPQYFVFPAMVNIELCPMQQAFRRYPALRERFNSVVVNFFKTSMTPTTKLVADMVAMQACYVNTTHPDFLNGHKAMAIVTDRLNASKPPPPSADPKSGKLAPGQINNNKDLEVDIKKEEPSFFGSFFSAAKGAQKKKGPQPMESVRVSSSSSSMVPSFFSASLWGHDEEYVADALGVYGSHAPALPLLLREWRRCVLIPLRQLNPSVVSSAFFRGSLSVCLR